jgi:hypothetical protein
VQYRIGCKGQAASKQFFITYKSSSDLLCEAGEDLVSSTKVLLIKEVQNIVTFRELKVELDDVTNVHLRWIVHDNFVVNQLAHWYTCRSFLAQRDHHAIKSKKLY